MDNHISFDEHFKLARALELHHAIFERIWSMSRIRFSKKVPTAGVYFNLDGECVDFVVNREFWEYITFIEKCFVISHECLHITLNHGQRDVMLDKKWDDIINIAQDLVINHTLVNRYGFIREEIDPLNTYCWVDKIFKDNANEISEDENYEYYFNLLVDMYNKNKEKFKKMAGEVTTVDDHSFGIPAEGEGKGDGKGKGKETDKGEGDPSKLDPDDFDYMDFSRASKDFGPVIDKLNNELGEEEKETIENFVKENEDSNGKPKENPTEEPTGVSRGGIGGEGSPAGTTAGTGWTFIKKVKNPKKHKFEYIITSWSRKKLVNEYITEDQWVHENRRFTAISRQGLFLPTEYETMNRKKQNDKIDVWFFQDTSASCGGYHERFFSIAEGMPLDRFNLRMFCFDTKVYETNLIDRKLFGFGGTSFHILENHIQKEMAENPKLQYPEAIFVVTDGEGTHIVPSKPKNWHWILTPHGVKKYIPETCNFHDLEDYK